MIGPAFGIILVLLWHQIPVTLLILLAVVGSIPLDLIDAARNLGATGPRVFRHVILPLALPGISAAALLVFIDCFGAYAVPSLLGPAYPQALPVMMTDRVPGRGPIGRSPRPSGW